MPETTFTVRWPDDTVQHCYSPSLVVHDHLSAGHDYPVEEFTARCRTALTEASDRVRARYGMACTAALAQLSDIERRAAGQAGRVHVLALEPPLPQETP
ncbi:MSMEG_0570 family nitrogen starvation response protein [Kineococcus rhizosphaerae]|uniref:Putative repeat protein (TIGR04042 family) n=1 Tax=Kineococcus rhizosphaerae TaxID=559628 RepID=A0A2T0QWR7_9ACTN|nr:MSMEG_0570 family nitrogen starvation response protein [Kineococcus rhizosphaerae]PRY09757.1 putative repeat protein (TIGR04042 family) [Kineococcus rhizosphaerae]